MNISEKLTAIYSDKMDIKSAITVKMAEGGIIGPVGNIFEQYPRKILDLKNINPTPANCIVDELTGNTPQDKLEHIQSIKSCMANAINACDVFDFDTDNLVEYSSAILRIQVQQDTELEIYGLEAYSGETCTFTAFHNRTVDVTSAATWDIVNGSEYATIGTGGVLTILSTADASPVTISATYGDKTAYFTTTITYTTGSTEETEVIIVTDESGNTTATTTSVVTNEDGTSSSASTTIITDENGHTTEIIETNTNNNADGSFNATSTTYDGDGNPTEGSSSSGDTEGNVNIQAVEYDESGNTVVTAYTIDTSNNPDGEKTYNGDGVNTEYYAFDLTRGFIMNIHFTIDMSNKPPGQNENHHNILTMKRAAPTPWYGFQLRQSNTTKSIILGTQFSTGSNTNTTINPTTITGDVGEYNIRITYNPTASTNNFVCRNMDTGTNILSKTAVFPDIPELRYLKVTIGYALDENGNPYRYSCINVMDFNITRT